MLKFTRRAFVHRKVHYKSSVGHKKRLGRRFSSVALVFLIVVSIVLPFINIEITKAANLELKPDTDVNVVAGWLRSTGTTAYTLLDEPSGSPVTTDYLYTGTGGSGGEIAEFGLSNTVPADNVDTVSNVKVYIYAYSATNGLGGTPPASLDTISINLRIAGALQTATTVTPLYSATGVHAWYSASFNGSWTPAQLDAAQAYLVRNRVGTSNPSSGRDDDIRIATVYADITYTQTTTFDQSSYRWFENEDSTSGITFAKAWGGTAGNDYGQSLVQTSDGGYAVTGYTASYGAGSNDMLLAKYDSTGSLSWSKTWGGIGSDNGQSLVQTSDGGYAVTGYTDSYGAGGNDMFLAKYDSSGTLSWSKTWGGTGIEYGPSLVQTSDGGYAVSGYTNSYGAGGYDMFLAKYASDGTLSWSRTWGGTGTEYSQSLVQTSDGGYTVTGYTTSYSAGSNDMFLAKYASDGTLSWSKTWGGTGTEYGYSLVQTSDGGYAVTGYTTSYGAGSNDMFLAKYDSTGSLSWSKTWGGIGSDYGQSLVQTSDGGYAVTGYTASYGAGNYDMFLAKYDLSGNIANCSSPMCQSPTATVNSPTASVSSPTATVNSPTATVNSPTASVSSPTATATTIVATPTIDVADPLAVLNTAANAPSEGTPFRLRMNLHVNTAQADAGSATFKLQYAARGADNVCDTSFTNETYTDLSPSSGAIRFYDNTNAIDGQPLATNANDPTHSTDDLVRQSYEESNNFTVANAIPAGDDGMWDFALVDANAPANTTYCFRAVSDTGTALNSYAVVPQITTASSTLSQASFRAYENRGVDVPGFIKGWGGTGDDSTSAIALDASGNIYVAGKTASTSLTSSPNDQTLVRYNSSGVEQWSKTWGGTGDDSTSAIALDASGNIYVAGKTASTGLTAGSYDQTLVKYNSSGVEQWSKTWDGEGYEDCAKGIAVAPSGDIYVIGYKFDADDITDQTLVKYNSSGVEQWSKTWGGDGYDTANVLALDSSGNIYVAGTTYSTGLTAGETDQTLVKYNSSGVEQWSKTWGGDGTDQASALALDASGNIYVAGFTASTGLTAGSYDQTLVKYNSSGVEQWSKTWGDTGSDFANALALDASGNIYVAGFTASTGLTAGASDQTLVKYNSSGVEQWSKTWGGTGNDIAYAIALDPSGNIYVAGETISSGLTAGGSDQTIWRTSTEADDCVGTCVLRTVTEADRTVTEVDRTVTEVDRTVTEVDRTVTEVDRTGVATITEIQVPKTFAKAWGGDGDDRARALALDSSGNIYVAGDTNSTGLTANLTDQTLVKYNSSGVEQWSKTWGGTGYDYARALALDSSGNIYVAGDTNSTGLTAGSSDQTLVKYDSAGVEQWSKTWGGTGSDIARALALDTAGNIYVAGYTDSTGLTAGSNDQTLIKYNSSGVEQWSKTWGGTGSDFALALALDSSGNIYVAGQTASAGLTAGSTDQTLVKYNSSGVEQWSMTWGGTGADIANALALDSSGNIYVAGDTVSTDLTSGAADQTLVKYDSSGTEVWSKTWGGTSPETALALALDTAGNIYVAGYTDSTGLTAGNNDQTLVKYNSSGVEQWSKTWGGTNYETAYALALDTAGNIYVAGYTDSTGLTAGLADQTLLKYDQYGDIHGCGTLCRDRVGVITNSFSGIAVDRTDTTVIEDRTAVTVIEDRTAVTTIVDRTTASTETTGVAATPIQFLYNGTPLAANSTRAELLETDMDFRLRIGIAANGKKYTSDGVFKLQSGVYTGTCDPATTSYTDVSSATSPLAFYDNSFSASNAYIQPDADDPTYSTNRQRLQSYVEANNFTNQRELKPGDHSIWDFALKADGAKIGRTYCFRIVESGASLNGGYTQYAEVYIPPTMQNVMRHGTFFNTRSVQQPFAWGRE